MKVFVVYGDDGYWRSAPEAVFTNEEDAQRYAKGDREWVEILVDAETIPPMPCAKLML